MEINSIWKLLKKTIDFLQKKKTNVIYAHFTIMLILQNLLVPTINICKAGLSSMEFITPFCLELILNYGGREKHVYNCLVSAKLVQIVRTILNIYAL